MSNFSRPLCKKAQKMFTVVVECLPEKNLFLFYSCACNAPIFPDAVHFLFVIVFHICLIPVHCREDPCRTQCCTPSMHKTHTNKSLDEYSYVSQHILLNTTFIFVGKDFQTSQLFCVSAFPVWSGRHLDCLNMCDKDFFLEFNNLPKIMPGISK